MVQELAGLGGDVGFIKHELTYQLNVPVTEDVVSSTTSFTVPKYSCVGCKPFHFECVYRLFKVPFKVVL